MFALEPARLYQGRFVVRRRINSSDPANDAVRAAVAWYDQNKILLSVAIVENINDLTVASGRQQRITTFSRSSGAGAAIVAPSAARYARLYAQTFGSADSQTDVEVLDTTDLTDLAAWSPDVSVFDGRLVALESLDAGDRLSALESAVTAPNIVRYATRADAIAASIPASADQIEMLGWSAQGDGWNRTYTRVGGDPSHFRSFQNTVDNSWWEDNGLPPIVLVFTGQSNFFMTRAYSSTYLSSVKLWNNGYTDPVAVGTDFALLPNTNTQPSWSYANEVAKRNPDREVFVINVSWGSMDVSRWSQGHVYLWDSGTTAADPGSGNIRGNNADLTAVTALYMNSIDFYGADKTDSIMSLNFVPVANKVRIIAPGGPTVVDYTVTGNPTDHGAYHTIPVTHSATPTGSALSGGIFVQFAPRLGDALKANVAPALAKIGVSKITELHWWQAESDARFNNGIRYAVEWEEAIDLLKAESWMDGSTPIRIWGINNEANTSLAYNQAMNNRLLSIAAADPDHRTFINTAAIGAGHWQDANSVHLTDEGQQLAGLFAAKSIFDGVARKAEGAYADEDGYLRPAKGIRVGGAAFGEFDYYGEADIAPEITFATPGDLSVAYTFNIGHATRIGRLVTVQFLIQTSSFTHTTASGNLRVTGLPFNQAVVVAVGQCGVEFQGITKAGYTSISAVVVQNANYMQFKASGSGVASAFVTAADMPSGGSVRIVGTISYIVP